ncbi:MAG: hypothetical protein KGN34_18355 [Sphingomonadales bacterium]|nr:hypothetical protein [Sphingomonadales bacterium]
MPTLHAGYGAPPRAHRARRHPHNLAQGLLCGTMIAAPLWLLILKAFGLI